jgi:hypothetical protein
LICINLKTGKFMERNALQDVAPLLSKYLLDGVYQDKLTLKNCELEVSHLQAVFGLESYGISPEDVGGFHLTAPTVFRMAGQALVAHVHWLAGFAHKTVEVWVRDHQMRHQRPSRDAQHIPVKLQLLQAGPGARNPHMLKVVYQAEVDGGAVVGQTVSYADFSAQPQAMQLVKTKLMQQGLWVEPSALAPIEQKAA